MSNKATKIIVVSILVVVLAVLGLRFFSGEDFWNCVDGQWVKHGFPAGDKPDRECRNKTLEDTIHVNKSEKDESGMKDKSAEELNNSGEANIIVDSPKADEAIGLPVAIRGKARVFENTVNYRIKNSDGKIIMENYTTANSQDMGQFGSFEEIVNYPDPKDNRGSIEVFEYSAKDGSEVNKIEIPVTFKKIESMDIKIYFGNRKENSNDENCNQVYEVERRISKTQSVAKETLLELIAGTTLEDEDDGFFSEISKEAKINKINIKNEIAEADFSQELLDGIEGSCEKETIKAQISETLMQFPAVKDVKITVNGEETIP